MSNLIIAKNTTSTGTDNNMQTTVTLLRAFTMCGTISSFYCCDNSFIISFVNVYCPNTMSLGIFFFTKSLPNAWKKWLSMSLIQVHLPSPQYSLWRRKKIVLLKFDRLIYFCEQMKNSSQHVFGDLYCPTCPNGKCSSAFLEKKNPLITIKPTSAGAQKGKKNSTFSA